MSRTLVSIAIAAVFSACSAGAPDTEDVTASLRELTATVLAAPDPAAITIEEPQRFPAKWEWRAVLDGRAYACNADNRLRLPDCTLT